MSKQYYSAEDLRGLLTSEEISDEFRERIIAALKDGSDAAIKAVGFKHCAYFNLLEGVQDSERAL